MGQMEDDIKMIKEYMARNTWEHPVRCDELQIPTYDANANPLRINYLRDGEMTYWHELEYDVDGNLIKKKLHLVKS